MDEYFGKEITLTEPVVPIEADEALKIHMKCCEYLQKMHKQIQETGTSTMDIRDLIKDVENE